MSTIVETTEYLVKAILPKDTDISITSHEDNDTIVISISTLPEFIGQLIGKEGKVIKSLRTLLNLAYPEIHYLLEIK